MDRSDSLIRDDETLESLFGGRLQILQKKKGYRYTIDSVLLAHFVEPKKGERILELGAGSGVISLLLAFRNPGVRVTGLELQADLADMAGRSVSMNCLEGRVKMIQGDVRNSRRAPGIPFPGCCRFQSALPEDGVGEIEPREGKGPGAA